MKAYFLLHHKVEYPGALLDIYPSHVLVPLYQNAPLPTVESDDVIVSMGGPMSVSDKHPWLISERTFLKDCMQRGNKVLGICLGCQQITKALGYDVRKMKNPEIGWGLVETSDGESVEAFHWHGEECELPDNAELLLTNTNCKVQGYRLDNVLALQCHLEMTPGLISSMLEEFGAETGSQGTAHWPDLKKCKQANLLLESLV